MRKSIKKRHNQLKALPFWTGGKKIKKLPSPAGNWTPVSRVTGGDTDHYTTEDYWKKIAKLSIIFYVFGSRYTKDFIRLSLLDSTLCIDFVSQNTNIKCLYKQMNMDFL